jgi:hypothetical protein
MRHLHCTKIFCGHWGFRDANHRKLRSSLDDAVGLDILTAPQGYRQSIFATKIPVLEIEAG